MVWSVEQVESVAPSPAAITAAQSVATPARWRDLGADDRVVWGSFQGSGAEPYDTAVDHVEVGYRCTCPSRKVPCKHALALLLMWVRDQVPAGLPGPKIQAWIAQRTPRIAQPSEATAATPGDEAPTTEQASGDVGSRTDREGRDDVGVEPDAGPLDPPDHDVARNERVEKMLAGLTELDRWLDDRIRTGLADPALARYGTWDDLAARLVDAQAGSLANRIRRLAGLVGASPTWHDDVLAELGLLHLLSQAGRRLGALPNSLADAVATTVGWQVRRADVLAGVPDTDRWVVAGRSDRREDRIEVRRHWLRGEQTGRWALVLSFAAYRQSLDDSLEVGTVVHADLHRYPGPALRALVGRRHPDPVATMFPGEQEVAPGRPPGQSVSAAADEVGRTLVAEPWLDRVPTSVTASIVRRGDAWSIGDHTGTMPIVTTASGERRPGRGDRRGDVDAITMLLALSGGLPVDLTLEWTPHGVVPLAVHLDDRTVDIGPRADASFVEVA
jgi:hypothetical protein